MLDTAFLQTDSSLADVRAATQAAGAAFGEYAAQSAEARARFLERIAQGIEAAGEPLLEAAHRETALPMARLTGERGRTCGQLRMFADLIRSDAWLDIRIETADPDRKPLPKPEIRRTQVPLGPVAVFGASNFPLAFSVAGGDTASALAAGCPVVFKAHPGHPETSKIVAEAISQAAQECGMPGGVFSMVNGGKEVGRALVLDPHIYAVGFTGSLRGGRALFDLAAGRDRPIPVFAEMGSVNPVFVMPGALQQEGLGKAYADSLTLGVGQFCTNPGVVVGVESPAYEAFLTSVAARLSESPCGTMLHEGIRDAYAAGVRERHEHPMTEKLFSGEGTAPALFSVSGADFLNAPSLQEELFGPAAMAVVCRDLSEMQAVAEALEGQLTTSVHFAESDLNDVKALMPSLVRMAGRLIANGFPTGVEVNSAMQHGGPYPATTDSRSTSVGTAAILRFVRPVAFQDFPESLLPAELR